MAMILKKCADCELEYEGEICPECECMRQFSELEMKSLRLSDELSERLSELEFAKTGLKRYEDAVKEARNRIKENDASMCDFKWWTLSPSNGE